ncbi:MAG: GNAT family N-acetyltransferase [Bacilli bacterium]|nr:GNAT family N-acetyltransferase [Bacilli bacterium]
MLETKRLILRPFELSDLDDMYEYCVQEKVGPMAGWQPHKNKEETMKHLSSVVGMPNKFAIVLKEENKVIGAIDLNDVSTRFDNIDIDKNSKEIGAVLNEKYWAKGYMTEALDEVLRYGFIDLDLNVIYGSHSSKNIGSSRMQEKNGLKQIGKLESNRKWIDDTICDTILRKITKKEYLDRKAKLYFEKPSLSRKQDAIDYINEHIKYNSRINGTGHLNRYVLDDDKTYEDWLLSIEKKENITIEQGDVPERTYFLVRENDNKIVGMINIRLKLNKFLEESGAGHIGYGIRPTERRKGYNKVNLYLGLLELQKIGVKTALLGCLKENIGSSKTMKALGAVKIREQMNHDQVVEVYNIDVDNSIKKYKDAYEEKIIRR